MKGVKQALKVMFSNDTSLLGTFGLVINAHEPTVATKAAAKVKAQATKAARGIKGKKQRQAITAPAAAPAAPVVATPAAAPSPAAIVKPLGSLIRAAVTVARNGRTGAPGIVLTRCRGRSSHRAARGAAQLSYHPRQGRGPATKPMRIRSLHLENYRGFRDTTLDLNRPLTVLVGVNGSGKSSVLTAIATVCSLVLRQSAFQLSVASGTSKTSTCTPELSCWQSPRTS